MAHDHPALTIDDAGERPRGIALILHGGMSQSQLSVSPLSLAYLRMVPFAWSVRAQARGRLVVARLRNRVRGWNGEQQSSLHDARWALAELTRRYGPLPVGLIGHSLGGRTALRAAGEEQVRSVVALAPWIPPSEPSLQLRGRKVLLVHGTSDRMTSCGATAVYAARLRAQGIDTTHVELPGGHGMTRGAATWHHLASDFTVRALLASREDHAEQTTG